MADNDVALDSGEHNRILRERILREGSFSTASSQEHPKAIILAGQPGAGKGGLARAAEADLSRNAVLIDPDELRGFHPRVGEFQKNSPYTWADDTHPDASAWAKELRAEAIDARKNLILDTTLADGQKAVGLVRELQAKGYEVEIRAVATHRLESEHGVDERFSSSVDRRGYGRYVPESIRDQVYRDLPGNLNQVASETGVPIRIFDRSGVERYDSRTESRLPGEALDAAREARMRDPALTQATRDGLREQQAWHRDLPQTLPDNRNVSPETRERLLAERSEQRVPETIDRLAREAVDIDHGVRVQPRIRAGAALGIAGLALDAYDAADAVRTAQRLNSEGNRTGAESTMIHYGSRTVGGLAGAGLGMTAGAVAGVETGPGLFVTGLIGGGVGVFAGDKIAEWTDNRRIYNQDDARGNTWTYDPEHPDRGWQRPAPIDASNDGIDNPARGTLRASPAMANELNYKAASISAELVLSGPPAQRDPFVQPSGPGDSHSITPTSWERNAETGQWQRDVVLTFVERGMSPKVTEVADEARAAELDRAAAQVVAKNFENSPAMIAARYEAAFNDRGWVAHGDMPQAVRQARTDTDTLVASDGNRYERNGAGQWVNDGLIYDSTARGNLHLELESTRDLMQVRLPPPQPVQAPPPMTEEARLRDTVSGAFANAGVAPDEARIAAAATAVRATWNTHGLDPNTTALQLQRDADGRYSVDSPIASQRLDADGKTYVITAVTSAEEIRRAQTPAQPEPPAPDRAPAPIVVPRSASGAGNERRGDDVDDAQRPSTRQPTDQVEPTAFTPPAPSTQAPDPRDPTHPDHRLYQHIEDGVSRVDATMGRSFDATSERLAMAAFVDAKAAGLTSADHVAINQQGKPQQDGAQVHGGTLVFVVQGQDPSDPAARRSVTDVKDAVERPVEQSIERANQQAIQRENQREQDTQALAQRAPAPAQDEPGGRSMRL